MPTDAGTNKDTAIARKLKSITISGKVALERYTDLFNYFITPFAMNGNKIDIEVSFKIKPVKAARWMKASNNTNPLKKQANNWD